ncbi:MAG: response regulator [Nitrospinae bacterium]|nr:response regulator [Nitrospinota bacterium]
MSQTDTVPSQQQKILIVDDDPNIALLVQMALSKNRDYVTDIASDGLQALAKVAASPPDLILLDIMMPGMDGFEVCRRIKGDEKTRLIPVIMITAKSEIADKLKGIEIGANDYITKPFNPEELLARVQAHLRIKTLEGEVSKKKELEAVLKMAVTLQHEINNPLTGIIGNLELLTDWSDMDDGERSSAVRDALALSMRVKDIVIRMGNLTKLVSTQYVPGSEMIDLNRSTEKSD